MTGDLFYFLSALPSLRWGEKPPYTPEAFAAKCTEELGEKTGKLLSSISLLPQEKQGGNTEIQSKWMDFENFVRNTVAGIRKARLRRSGLTFTPGKTSILSPAANKRIEEIMAISSPVERENALDKYRWQFLDGLSADHFFDNSVLELYMLKLLLLEKQTSRQFAAGSEAFEKLMASGLAKAEAVKSEEMA